MCDSTERAQARKTAIEALLDYTPVNDDDTKALLDGILDNHATPATRWELWEHLLERYQWRQELKDGAHPGFDDDGGVQDRELALESVEEDITAALNSIAVVNHPAPARAPEHVRVAA